MHNVSEEIFPSQCMDRFWRGYGKAVTIELARIMDLSINKGNRRYVEINQTENTLLVGATAILVSCGGQKKSRWEVMLMMPSS